MATYNLSKSFDRHSRLTDRVGQVCRMFGLSADRLKQRCVIHRCQIQIYDGDIVYITGPSGAGKSVLLKELEKAVSPEQKVNLGELKTPKGRTLVDCFEQDLLTTLRLLSMAGLNDCFCVLEEPANLSEGQQYRFRLALALAAGKKFVFADEFCSGLDRVTASTLAYNIYKFAKKTGVTFVLASSHDDILPDLQPDVLIVKDFTEKPTVIYQRMPYERNKIHSNPAGQTAFRP